MKSTIFVNHKRAVAHVDLAVCDEKIQIPFFVKIQNLKVITNYILHFTSFWQRTRIQMYMDSHMIHTEERNTVPFSHRHIE